MWKYRDVPVEISNLVTSEKGREGFTGIAFPVKVVGRVTVAFQLQSGLFASWTVSKWDVVVCDFVEEVDLLLFQQ